MLPGHPPCTRRSSTIRITSRHDLSSLRVAVTGAADIPVELVRRVGDELPFSVVITGYGLTEAGTVCATSTGDDAETVATTVGRPRPGFEVRIMGGARRRLPAAPLWVGARDIEIAQRHIAQIMRGAVSRSMSSVMSFEVP